MLQWFDGRWQQHAVGFYVDKTCNLADPSYAHFHCYARTHTHMYICIWYGVRIPKWTRDFSPNPPDRRWDPTTIPFNGYRGYFLELKKPWREVYPSLPCSAEAKNGWSYTPPICLQGVYRDAFSLCPRVLTSKLVALLTNLNELLRVRCQPFISGPV